MASGYANTAIPAQKGSKKQQMALPWARNYNQASSKATPAPPSKTPAEDCAEKAQMSLPWHRNYTQLSGQEPATSSQYPNAVDIYYLDGEVKTLLGVASDKVKLARFSTTASSQLKSKRGSVRRYAWGSARLFGRRQRRRR